MKFGYLTGYILFMFKQGVQGSQRCRPLPDVAPDFMDGYSTSFMIDAVHHLIDVDQISVLINVFIAYSIRLSMAVLIFEIRQNKS